MAKAQFVSYGLYPREKKLDTSFRRLAQGILTQAFRDVVMAARSRPRREWKEDSLDWFLDEDRGPGSLHWVCEILHLEPETLRDWVQNYQSGPPEARERMVGQVRKIQFRV